MALSTGMQPFKKQSIPKKKKKVEKSFQPLKKNKKIEPQQNNDFLIIVIIKAGGLGKKGQVKVRSLWEKHCKPEKIIWVI